MTFRNLVAIFGSVWMLSSCGPSKADDSSGDYRDESQKLSKVLARLDTSSQFFDVSGSQKSVVTGKKGTVIHVDPAILMTHTGQPPDATIRVELKELMNPTDFFTANVNTMSSGKMLLSGGAYFIGMTSGGKELRVRAGSRLAVDFRRISTKRMELFWGDRDTINRLDWTPANQKFKKLDAAEDMIYDMNGNVVSSVENKKFGDVYQTMDLRHIGWISCNAFNRMEIPTELAYSFGKPEVAYAEVFLIFKDINSAMQQTVTFRKSDELKFQNIPFDAKVKLVAVAQKDGKLYAFATDLILGKQDNIVIRLKPIDNHRFGKLLDL